MSKLEHAGVWICCQIALCVDTGAACAAVPSASPEVEKSGDMLSGGYVAEEQGHAQREVPYQG